MECAIATPWMLVATFVGLVVGLLIFSHLVAAAERKSASRGVIVIDGIAYLLTKIEVAKDEPEKPYRSDR